MPISTKSICQGGVSVTASQTDGRLSAFTVLIPDTGLAFTARLEAGLWHMALPGMNVSGASFEVIWDAVPKAVRAKPDRPWIPVKATLAEIIDRHGRVTAPDRGYSRHKEYVENAYACLVDCYGNDCGIAVLRKVTGVQGYKMVPDLELIGTHPECHAYHEVVGGIYDDMVEDGAPDVKRVLQASGRLKSFRDHLNEVSAERDARHEGAKA